MLRVPALKELLAQAAVRVFPAPLSLTLFEKTPLNQLLSNIEPDTDTTTNSNQLDLFT